MVFLFTCSVRRALYLAALGLILAETVCCSAVAQSPHALQFTGSTFYACPMRLDSLPQFTIEVWMRLDSALQTGRPVSYGGDSSGFGFFLSKDLAPGFPSPLTIAEGDQNPSITGNCILPDLGQWIHITITKKDSVWKLYRNGMLAGRGIATMLSGDSILRIGQFYGALQQLRIWSAARSAEEIRTDLYRIDTTSNGLYASFILDNTTDSIRDPVNGFVLHRIGATAGVTNIPSGLLFQSEPSPAIAWTSLPAHLQFIPRNASGYGVISISGNVLEAGYDSIIFFKSRNGSLEQRFAFGLPYTMGTSSFRFQDSFLAERSLYSYGAWCKKGNSLFYIGEAADLTAGDVYLIDGQSNAHAAIAWFYWQSPFLRSFGVQTGNENFDAYNPADTLWGLSNANDWGQEYINFTGPYMAGVWGWELQNQILNNAGIPTCVINGAAGGSTIEQHERSDSNPEDLQTVYGRLLYRTQKSGCKNYIKGIFWDQGEYNTAQNYYQNFKALYQAWQQDYPASATRITYVLQVRPGCGPVGGSALREVQRTLADSLPYVEVMSTAGVRGHDGCHYDAYGYVDIGNDLARLVDRDYYGSSDTAEIDAPNIARVYYADKDSSIISIVLQRPENLSIIDDTPLGTHSEAIENYFYLDGRYGFIDSALLRSDSIRLILKGHSTAEYLSYLPDQNYNDTEVVYEGPWIGNSRGIGLLTFDSIPIQPFQSMANVPPIVRTFPLLVSIVRKNGEALVQFSLSTSCNASVTIYDVLGRSLQRTLLPHSGPGTYSIPIEPNDRSYSGTYIAIVRTNTQVGSAVTNLP